MTTNRLYEWDLGYYRFRRRNVICPLQGVAYAAARDKSHIVTIFPIPRQTSKSREATSIYLYADVTKPAKIRLTILLFALVSQLWYTIQCTLIREISARQGSRYRRSNEGQLCHRRTGGRGTRCLTATNAPIAAAGKNPRSGKNWAPVVRTPACSSTPTGGEGIHNQDGYARGVVESRDRSYDNPSENHLSLALAPRAR